MIRKVSSADAPDIVEIYNYYIQNSIITFEEAPINTEEMKRRIGLVSSIWPWLVYEREGRVVGYAYANEWKERSAYKNSAESTVYLQRGEEGKGIGFLLYRELIDLLKQNGVHAVMGGISLPNEASVALHEKLGFEKVAHFKEVGNKFGQWIDVGYWELIL